MNFEYGADPYFVREQAFERIAECARCPGNDAEYLAAVQPERIDLPIRAAEPGPNAAGAQDHSKTGFWSGDTGRSRVWPTIPVSAARPCNIRCCSIRTSCSPMALTVPQVLPAAGQQQRQCRRRLLFAGRPVLLHPRSRAGAEYGRHREHRGVRKERHPDLRERLLPR